MSENDQVEAYLRVEAVEAIYDVSILALRGVTFGYFFVQKLVQ